ncbi:hypothetical protein [Lolliginicoccus suaedae]|uniref:hypothetical protein n=1 Tax=Lolliginicoccus suaedae TaxID=2605429 RepID=UPI0011ED9C8A|nr:hypothetical protein [Lolliginicoccus suaedae]
MSTATARWWPTHVLSAEEIASACVRTVPDIEPFLPSSVEPGEHMHLPTGAFAGICPGELVALRIDAATVSLVPVDRSLLPAPPPALRTIMRRFARDHAGQPGGLAALVEHASEHLPGTGAHRTLPLGELLARYGIVAAGDRIALEGFDFAAHDTSEQIRLLAVAHDLARDAASAVHEWRSCMLGGSTDAARISALARTVDEHDALEALIEPWVHDIATGSPPVLERRAIVASCIALAPCMEDEAARVLLWAVVVLSDIDAPLGEVAGHAERLRSVAHGWAPGTQRVVEWDFDRGSGERARALLGSLRRKDRHRMPAIVEPDYSTAVERVLGKALRFLESDGPARLALMGVVDGIMAGTLDGAMARRLVEDGRVRMVALREGGVMARFVERRGTVLPPEEAVVASAMRDSPEHRMRWAVTHVAGREQCVTLRDDDGTVMRCRVPAAGPMPGPGALVLAWIVADDVEPWALSLVAVPGVLGGDAGTVDAIGALGALVRSEQFP